MRHKILFLRRRKWTPLRISNLVPSINVALSRSMGFLWQDPARTILAVNDSDPVYFARCPYTGPTLGALADFTATNTTTARPLLKTDGAGRWYFQGDGVNTAMNGPAAATLSGAQSIVMRATQTVASGASRIVRSISINALIAYQRGGNCVFVNANVHAAQIVTDANRHTFRMQKAAGGPWAIWLDGASLAVDGPVTNDFSLYGIGAGGLGGTAETWAGAIYAVLAANSNLDAATAARAEAYVAALSG